MKFDFSETQKDYLTQPIAMNKAFHVISIHNQALKLKSEKYYKMSDPEVKPIRWGTGFDYWDLFYKVCRLKYGKLE